MTLAVGGTLNPNQYGLFIIKCMYVHVEDIYLSEVNTKHNSSSGLKISEVSHIQVYLVFTVNIIILFALTFFLLKKEAVKMQNKNDSENTSYLVISEINYSICST